MDDLPPEAPPGSGYWTMLAAWFARQFVVNVRDVWKWATTWWSVGGAIVLETIAANWDQVVQYIPPNWIAHAGAGALIINIFWRVYNQRQAPKP
jgi:hypothetical protein